MTDESRASDDIDTEGRTLPPYDGRRESADVRGQEASTVDGVKVGGATGPVEDDETKTPDPAATPGGATGSPADEQPAADTPRAGSGDHGTGPAHHDGTPRAEDQS